MLRYYSIHAIVPYKHKVYRVSIHATVVYFEQLSGACSTRKLVETWVDQLLHVNQLWGVDKYMFFCSFFVDFSREITEKALKWTKKVEKRLKKWFDQLSGAASTGKPVKIHNTQIFQGFHGYWPKKPQCGYLTLTLASWEYFIYSPFTVHLE